MKKLALSFLLFASAAFGQNYGPGATIFYNGFPPPTLGTSCAGLPSGFAGYVTSNGIIQTCSGTPPVWTQQAILPVGSSQLQSTTATGNVAMQVCHATWDFTVDGGGAPGLITPAANCTIPANSIIFNEIIDFTTAAVGVSNTTSIGTTGTGGGAAILLAATAVGSLTGIVQGLIVPQTASGFKKLTTAGAVTLTTATAALTAGHAEIYIFFVTSPT